MMSIDQANKVDEDLADEDSRLLDNDPTEISQLSAIWICSAEEPDTLDVLNQYTNALSELPLECELIIVANGDMHCRNELIGRIEACHLVAKIVQLHRYCDESTAIRTGLEASRGDLIVLLPTYVQSDPHAIIGMLDEIKRGAHYVASWRNPRVGSRWSAFKSRLFNVFTSYMTGIKLHDTNSGLRVMKREVTENLPIYGDLDRFLPVLAAMQGFQVSEVIVRHVMDREKKGNNRFGVYMRRILDLMTLFFLFKFTKKPLRFFGLIGSVSLGMGGLIIAGVTVQRFLGTSMADRPALLLGVVFLVLGAQLFSGGLLGELIIFTHGRHLFHQHVEEIHKHSSKESD
ncbi:MAG: hypothetical protein ABGX16_14070 [Pirellulales bacterium]